MKWVFVIHYWYFLLETDFFDTDDVAVWDHRHVPLAPGLRYGLTQYYALVVLFADPAHIFYNHRSQVLLPVGVVVTQVGVSVPPSHYHQALVFEVHSKNAAKRITAIASTIKAKRPFPGAFESFGCKPIPRRLFIITYSPRWIAGQDPGTRGFGCEETRTIDEVHRLVT